MIPDAVLVELRHDIVTRQLDDVNVLGEALVAALNDEDEVLGPKTLKKLEAEYGR